jgi:hypothetical protein
MIFRTDDIRSEQERIMLGQLLNTPMLLNYLSVLEKQLEKDLLNIGDFSDDAQFRKEHDRLKLRRDFVQDLRRWVDDLGKIALHNPDDVQLQDE